MMLQVGLLLLMSGLVSGSITCPDGTMCSDHSTCCTTLNGYECCAVSEKENLETVKSSVIRCDRTHYCPEKTTCCNKSGTWACCPYPLATCCKDGYHCCPHNYTCDRTSTKCNREGLMIPSAEKESAMTDTDDE
ncbi:progranulin-like [Polyodon spathula]|uniref:progranulin-like n=1 Tax=Polyodon spathula TaxID=7913 RepID=UPI001B7EA51B|nr:progranulin-like [Polyodon spathula]